VLHGEEAMFLEGYDTRPTVMEQQANEFAARILVPHEFQTALLDLRADGREIIRFARHLGVSPGIVVGQLQHLGRIKHNRLNYLKRRFEWGN
jgi:Zn-dependent peptidase ImmA (M78 family)